MCRFGFFGFKMQTPSVDPLLRNFDVGGSQVKAEETRFGMLNENAEVEPEPMKGSRQTSLEGAVVKPAHHSRGLTVTWMFSL